MGTNILLEGAKDSDPAMDNHVNEEEKIKELMRRSDTAVIFPEPVSDHEDDECKRRDMPNSAPTSSPPSEIRPVLSPSNLGCHRCSDTFANEIDLDKHMLLHSDTSDSVPHCHVCKKTFANVYRLQRHLISHDESTDLRKFKCPECSKAFKFKHHLKEHIRIHSGEKPFQCRTCGKRFSHSGSYSSHMSSKKCWGNAQNGHKSPGLSTLPGVQGIYDMPGLPRFSLGQMPMLPYLPMPSVSPMPPFLPLTKSYPFQLDNRRQDIVKIEPEEPKQEKMDTDERTFQDVESLDSLKSLRRDWSRDSMELCNKNQTPETHMMCQYCEEKFSSAVDLHQHERYICEMNRSSSRLDDKDKYQSSGEAFSSAEEELSDTGSKDNSNSEKSKCRVRSLISEDQLQVLRSHYKMNPRPRKHELMKIGEEIGFPKRVVQVWFQNSRARDRKQGREVPYFPNMARARKSEFDDRFPFIPSVPRPFSLGSNVNFTPAHSHHVVKTQPQVSPNELPLPLDLTTPKSRSSTPGHSTDDGALNLSFKPLSPAASTRSDDSFRSSLPSPQHSFRGPPLPSPHIRPVLGRQQLFDRNGNVCGQKFQSPGRDRPFEDSGSDCSSMEETPDLNLPTAPWLCALPPSAQALLRQRMENSPIQFDTNNRFNLMSSLFPLGPMSGDRGAPARPSWKPVKEEEDGIYSCDQCEKRFSKQSSLARHKYEHSGARPFACDVCPKAFKHKHHLTEHKRLHSGEKPFCCGKCGKRFSHSGSYSQHMNHRYKYCKPLNVENELKDGGALGLVSKDTSFVAKDALSHYTSTPDSVRNTSLPTFFKNEVSEPLPTFSVPFTAPLRRDFTSTGSDSSVKTESVEKTEVPNPTLNYANPLKIESVLSNPSMKVESVVAAV